MLAHRSPKTLRSIKLIFRQTTHAFHGGFKRPGSFFHSAHLEQIFGLIAGKSHCIHEGKQFNIETIVTASFMLS